METKMKIAVVPLVLMISSCAAKDGPMSFGYRFQEPYLGRDGGVGSGGITPLHNGLDLNVSIGTPVRSPADGVVSMATIYNVSGVHTNVLEIKHEIDGVSWRSRYIHIDYTRKLNRGDIVRRGEVVAHTSRNGPAGPFSGMPTDGSHLHFEIYREGMPTDPESLKMSCGDTGWLWPVGCKSN